MIVLMLLIVVYLTFLCWLLLFYGEEKEKSRKLTAAIVVLSVLILMVFGLNSILGRNLYFDRAIFAVGLICIGVFVNFIASLQNHTRSIITVLKSFFDFTIVLVSILSVTTPFFIKDVSFSSSESLPMPIYGNFMFIYYGLIILAIAFVIGYLVKGNKEKDIKVRSQIKIVASSILVASAITLFTNIIIPGVTGSSSSSQLVSIAGLVMATGMSYAIIRYGMFDIKQAAIRTFAYILSLTTIALVYYFLALIVYTVILKNQDSTLTSINPVNMVLTLFLAFVFQPIKKFFDKITNRIFFKDNYNTDEFFAKINKTLGLTIDLRGMLERVSNEIALTLKGEQAFFYIVIDEDHYVSAGTPKHKLIPKSDIEMFKKVTDIKGGIIIASMLDDDDAIKRMMMSHRIELVLPLIKDKKTFGYLCLGDHLTSSYKNRDLTVLNTISDALMIAIQNALAVQEIREFNETLKQRIANATVELRTSNRMLRQLDKAKDEFVGMASHQLRTPLTSVKGYISMVIDGDAGQITDSQKQLLDEAFKSSERMVNLINDFLNVSRIQTGKFMLEKSPVDLSKLVEQEIDSLQSNATAYNLKFIYNQPKDFPMIDMDESKIRQVVMNFIDNSIYYSHENTNVAIKLLVESGEAVFKVEDSGIGVPVSERSQLFTKFYRASNARIRRPDGTGVGLYLAKKIIDAHDGKIIFSSNKGSGSTFGFRLPIK